MVALVAPGALVAACSGGDSPGGGSAADGTAGDGTAGGGSAPAGGGGLAALADVPDGGGLIVDTPGGGKILLARTGDEVTAYNAACTHMGTVVDAPKDGVAVCSNHGSEFDTATGAAKKGPATQPLPTIEVKVEGDQVVLA
jgi:nitrite reductase/ring-hydroxylating ferredoxin subunit